MSWSEQRARAIAEHAAAQARARAVEIERARELIDGFVREARERGLAASRLTAQAYSGRARYRTNLRGWYLRADRSVAIGTDGEFYLLTVPASLRARITGAVLRPDEPRLVIGEGARDGESMPLAELLRRRLDAGGGWPDR